MGKRLAYTLLGIGIGLVIAWGIQSAVGKSFEIGGISTVIGIACGAVAVSIAERKGKVKSIEELKRPTTLFPKQPT